MAGDPRGKRGRTQTYSDVAIQFCLPIKNLFGLPVRQTIGFIQSLLKLTGLGWGVPDYSTLSRRQQTLQVKIPYQKSPGALHLLLDSTGIKMLGEGEWKTKKHGAEYRRQWRKVHLGIDPETQQIRATEVTDNRQADAQMLPSLLAQIPADEPIGCVSGDGAFDTKACHEAIAARGAIGCPPPPARMRERGKAGRWVCWLATRFSGDQATREGDLEALEWLPSPQLGGNQAALRQTAG